MKFVKKIANRYLWSRKGENFINAVSVFAILGVALGVAVLNITMAIMTGFEQELHKKLVGSSHIFVGNVSGPITDWQGIEGSFRSIDEVENIVPYIQGQVMITAGQNSFGMILKGLADNSEVLKDFKLSEAESFSKLWNQNKAASESTSEPQLPSLLLGEGLKKRLPIYQHQVISLLSPKVISGPFGLAPRQSSFNILDFYSTGQSGYEENFAYTNITTAQRFLRMGDAVSGLEISLKDPNQAPRIKNVMIELLREQGNLNYYVQDWTEINAGLWEAISLEKRAYFIILMLLIVLASFSIVTTLIMIVLEKRKDIAVMRTLGAKASTIRHIFIYIGGMIGLLGTILGLVLGLIGSFLLQEFGFQLPENVFPTNTLPIVIDFQNFLIVAVIAWLICLLATLYPARRASLLSPCDILRYE